MMRHKQRSLTHGVAAAGGEQQQPQSEVESLHDDVGQKMMTMFFFAVIDS